MAKKESKLLYWAPRILALLFILSLSVLSLSILGESRTFEEKIFRLIINNLPGFILLITLILSFRYEIIPGVAFVIFGCVYSSNSLVKTFNYGFENYMLYYLIILAVPSFVIGILFLTNWYKKLC